MRTIGAVALRAREHNRPPSPPDRLPPRRGGRPSSQTASAAGGRGLVGFARGLAAAACLALFGALALPSTAEAQTAPVCDRTEQVRDAIVAAVPGVSACANVTTAHLAAITYLGLGSAGFTSLQAGDFSGLTALTYLDLAASNLPAVVLPHRATCNNSPQPAASVFDGLTALRDPLPGQQLPEQPAGERFRRPHRATDPLPGQQLPEQPAGERFRRPHRARDPLPGQQLPERPAGESFSTASPRSRPSTWATTP